MKTMQQKLITALTAAVACFLLIPTAAADQVINDDLIVTGSLCVGFDCVNGESFGFDTIRIKENNLRIVAVDTSSTGSFPTQDWSLTFNESANGGLNKFSIEATSPNATIPFTIEAGGSSTNHALYVDDGGRVGFGTNNPVVDLHVKSGNTPALRLEQDGSSGFTAQTWDVAGNEANFFVRDVTGGSALPFRIRPGAPSSSIDIAAGGKVGIGTGSPSAGLHVARNIADPDDTVLVAETGSSNATVRVKSDGTANSFFLMQNANNTWSFSNSGSNFVIQDSTFAGQLTLTPAGNLTLTGNCADGNGGGGGVDGCDAVFQPGYKLDSIEEHAALMWEKSYLPAVGPTPDGQRITLNVQQRHFGVLNELEKAHIYIDQLNEKLKEKDRQMSELSGRLARLEATLLGGRAQ